MLDLELRNDTMRLDYQKGKEEIVKLNSEILDLKDRNNAIQLDYQKYNEDSETERLHQVDIKRLTEEKQKLLQNHREEISSCYGEVDQLKTKMKELQI